MSAYSGSQPIIYLEEVRAETEHVSTISEHNSKSCSLPVTSYDRKQVKAVPSKPVYTVGSIPVPVLPSLSHVTSTTCIARHNNSPALDRPNHTLTRRAVFF